MHTPAVEIIPVFRYVQTIVGTNLVLTPPLKREHYEGEALPQLVDNDTAHVYEVKHVADPVTSLYSDI